MFLIVICDDVFMHHSVWSCVDFRLYCVVRVCLCIPDEGHGTEKLSIIKSRFDIFASTDSAWDLYGFGVIIISVENS